MPVEGLNDFSPFWLTRNESFTRLHSIDFPPAFIVDYEVYSLLANLLLRS